MTDLLKLGKKVFTVSVVALTIMWSVGVAALVPTVVNAETCPTLEAGDLFKIPGNTAVYLVNSDMERMYFFNAEVYKSWYKDYAGITEIPATCTDAYPSGGAVAYRAGSMLVKTVISPSVYAVLPMGKLLKIADEASAKALYGATWSKLVRDLPDVYFDTYTVNSGTLSDTPHNGMLVKKATGDTYFVKEGKLVKVDGELPAYVAATVRTVSDATFATLTMDAGTVTAASLVDDPSQGMTKGGTGETPVTGGPLTVSLAADAPAAGNVVINVDNVVFGKFTFKAGSSDVIVNSVKLGRTGLGQTGDFVSVTLYDGATKLGSTKTSWNSDNTMTYNISGGWTIPAGTSKTLTVTAKLDTAATYNALGIVSMGTTASAVTGLPVYGNQMSGVNVAVGGVTIANAGTSQTKKIGTQAVTLASFKLTLNSVEDAKFESVTLKNKAASYNAADSNVANLYLYAGSTKLAGPVAMTNDKITFVMDEPRLIEKSKNETYKVVGDIVDGVGNRVEYVLDTTTDLKVRGQVYNAYLSVTSTDYNESGESATTTIDGAELNLSYTGTNLDTVDDRDDVNFGTLTLSAGATDIKISALSLFVDETDASGGTAVVDVDNLELVDQSSGAAYSGAQSAGADGTSVDEQWDFTDEIYLTAGESRKFTIQGDLPDGIANGDSYKVNMTVNTTYLTAETVPAGDAVDNFSIGSFTGKLVTVKSPTLKVTGLTQNNGTAVVNDTDVTLFKGYMEASADDIKVSYADFDANSVFSTDNWTQVGFYTASSLNGPWTQQQLVTNSSMTTGTMTFDSLDFTVKNGVTNKVYFMVKGTVASTLNSATGATLKLDYFTAKDTDNNDVVITSTGSDNLSTSAGAYLTTGGRTVTLNDKGKLFIQLRNNDAGYNKDRIVLAGSGYWAGKLKLRADDESIKLKDLKLTNANSTADDSVNSVCLYTAAEVNADKLVGCTTLVSGVAFFDDVNYEIAQGTQYLYVYVDVAPMNNLAGGTADTHDTLQFAITTTTADSVAAEGVRSGHTFTYAGADASAVVAGEYAFDYDLDESYNEAVDARTASTTFSYVSGSRISNVQFVSSYGGETVDSVLSGTGEYTAAIIAVTAENNSNTDSNGNALKAGIAGFSFDMAKFASTTLSGATLKRIGGSTAATGLAASTGDNDMTKNTTTAGTFSTTTATTTLGADAYVEPGQTAYFVVKVTVSGVTALDNTVNWFRLDMNDLKGTYNTDANNNVDWYSDVITSDTPFNALLLDTTSITGTKVAELS